MALRKFTPDPDLFDAEDPNGWYGTWEHDDGSKLYGQGTEEMGRPLLDAASYQPPAAPSAANDQRTAQLSPDDNGPEAWHAPMSDPDMPDPNEEELDSGSPLEPGNASAPPASPGASAPGAPPAAGAPAAGAPTEKHGWEDDVPPQVANALNQQAQAAGLNPSALAGIIQHESGWDPGAVNPKTGKHAGLIQFSEKGWPEVAAAAGQPDVSWDQMKGMSAQDQIPFVVAYYKDKGLKPESGIADYAMRTFMPAFANEKDDFVLGERGSNEMRGDVRSGKVFEQNQGLDLNRDGKITKGEVGAAYARGGGSAPTRDALPSSPPMPGMGGTLPPSFEGLPPAAAEVQGVPLTPEQIQQRQQDVGQKYATLANAHQQAEAARVQGKQEVLDAWNAEATKQSTDANEQLRIQSRSKVEADQKIENEVNRPIQQVDPGRLVRNMSTGAKVVGGIAILMSELGRGLTALAGAGDGPNLALQMIMKRIDNDIDSQKENIGRDERASNNRVAYWTKKLGSAEDGVSAARAEAHQAAGMMLQGKAMGSDIQDVKAQGMEYAAQIFAEGQNEIQAIKDREAQRITMRYAVPKPTKVARGALEGVPQIARVGVEDQSPEARAALANEYNAASPTDRSQMTALTKEMGQVTELEQTLDTLKQHYGVADVKDGNYPTGVTRDPKTGQETDNDQKYNSTATGPWWNVKDLLTPNDQRDRAIHDAWLKVETGTRAGWKTEPNGEVKQIELSGIDQPKRDTDVPLKLRVLETEIQRRKEAIMSGTNAPVRAAYKLQNGYPLTGSSGGRPLEGQRIRH